MSIYRLTRCLEFLPGSAQKNYFHWRLRSASRVRQASCGCPDPDPVGTRRTARLTMREYFHPLPRLQPLEPGLTTVRRSGAKMPLLAWELCNPFASHFRSHFVGGARDDLSFQHLEFAFQACLRGLSPRLNGVPAKRDAPLGRGATRLESVFWRGPIR